MPRTPLYRPAIKAARCAFGLAAVASIALLALSSAPALAASAACEGQTFSQPFEAYGDLNVYTLVQGSQFNAPEEGWELGGGAKLSEGARPDGSSGGVLELPAGATAVSPPVCVTLLYPTARVWLREAAGSGNVKVAVVYAGRSAKGRSVAALTAGGSWSPSVPFEVRPELGGTSEEAREVRFILHASGGQGFQLYGLYVDPRMI